MHREPISSNLVSATSDPFWFSHFSAVSSSLFQGFKSLQLRLIGPGLVGFGLLLTVVCLLLRNMMVVLVNGNPSSILWSMTIHQVRVLLCTLPPYINGCRWSIVPLFRCSLPKAMTSLGVKFQGKVMLCQERWGYIWEWNCNAGLIKVRLRMFVRAPKVPFFCTFPRWQWQWASLGHFLFLFASVPHCKLHIIQGVRRQDPVRRQWLSTGLCPTDKLSR